jgi:uncharacterized membrane protein YccC
MAAAMFPLAVAALAVRRVSLGLFMTALTPLIVLLVEIGEPDTSEWVVAAARAGLALIGGVVAVGACVLLWPSRVPGRLLQEARGSIGAHGRYAEAGLAHLLDGAPPEAVVDQARREAGLTSNSLEASINLALNDPGAAGRNDVEAVLLIDAALRRLAGRLSAMQLDPAVLREVGQASLRAWGGWIGSAMRALADGEPVLPSQPETKPSDALARIARQIELMAGALARDAG